MSKIDENENMIQLFQNAINIQRAIISKAELSISNYQDAIKSTQELIDNELNELEVVNG